MRFISAMLAGILGILSVCFFGYAVLHYNPWLNMFALFGGFVTLALAYICVMHLMGDL